MRKNTNVRTLRGVGEVREFESGEGTADAVNLWGAILHCSEMFSSSPKSSSSTEGGYLD